MIPGVMIGDEHRHESFEGSYKFLYQVHEERASVAADLSELIPGAISGSVTSFCGPVREQANDCIHHATLHWVANAPLFCVTL